MYALQLYKHSTVNFLFLTLSTYFPASLHLLNNSSCIRSSNSSCFLALVVQFFYAKSHEVTTHTENTPFWIIFFGWIGWERKTTEFFSAFTLIHSRAANVCIFVLKPMPLSEWTSKAALPKSPSPTMITFNNFVTKHCYRPFRFLVYVLYASRSLHFANSLLATIYTHTFHSSTRPFFYITFMLKLCVSILSFVCFFNFFLTLFVNFCSTNNSGLYIYIIVHTFTSYQT